MTIDHVTARALAHILVTAPSAPHGATPLVSAIRCVSALGIDLVAFGAGEQVCFQHLYRFGDMMNRLSDISGGRRGACSRRIPRLPRILLACYRFGGFFGRRTGVFSASISF